MNKLAAQRQSRPLLPELSDLLNGIPAFAGIRPQAGGGGNPLRLEDENRDDRYVVRAELPGVDPVEEVEVTVCDGELTIKADRSRTADAAGTLSEFTYGSFLRTVSLPAGADEDNISATYDRGILTIEVPLWDATPTEKHVSVVETTLLDDEHGEGATDGAGQEQSAG